MPVYFGVARGLLALALIVAGFTFSALAQHQTSTSAESCSKAKTCSEQLRLGITVGCHLERASDCYTVPQRNFETCMKTGEWNGRNCQAKGLIKK